MMPTNTGLSASVDVNNCHILESTSADTQDLPSSKLGNDLTEFPNIENDGDGVPGSKPPYGKHNFQNKDIATEKCFDNCATFSCSSKTTSSAGTSVEASLVSNAIIVQESTPHHNINSADPSCSCSSSLPTNLKPISAMKGSREKRGATPPQNLTVKWDPDVYDPIPTSDSHTVRNNKSQKPSKKNSKSKQKNKSSRGNKHKDKLTGKRGGG